MRRTQPDAVAYTSKVDRDDDGAPHAYHLGSKDAGADPGLDHICVGGSVLEFVDGRLRDRYGDGGSIGQLGGKDPKTGTSRSEMWPTDYHPTTTALRRPGAPGESRVQADCVDAAQAPYAVLPGGLKLPVATPWAVGDLAVVVSKGRSVYAVVGDTGPGNKIGEASRATLAALYGGKRDGGDRVCLA
jgi:hypothetical protein